MVATVQMDALERFRATQTTLPVQPSTDPAYFELEREKLFRRVWLQVANIAEIPNTGDYVIREIPALGAELVVVRANDQVRVFHNTCLHRGGRLVHVAERRGTAPAFVCTFHGWSYKLDGSLSYVPDEPEFENFDRACINLKAVRSEMWEGHIFVNFSEESPPLSEYMGPLYGAFEGYLARDFELIGEYSFPDVHANWKVLVDAFSEGYHAKVVHKKMFSTAFNSKDNPHGHVGIEFYGIHPRMEIPINVDHVPSKMQGILASYAAPQFTGGAARTDRLPKTINPNRIPNWGFDTFTVFPNFQILVSNDWYASYHYVPVSVNRSRFEVRVYFPRPTNLAERLAYQFQSVLLRDSFREDLSTVEGQQVGMESGAITELITSNQEVCIRNNRALVEQYINGDRA